MTAPAPQPATDLPTGPDARPALAYLVSQYPAASHTFILREVRALRALGLRIEVASINDPDRPPERLAAEERDEVAGTFYVKAAGPAGAARAHAAALRTRPKDWWRGLRYAMALGRGGFQRRLLTLAYFVEAVMVGHWLVERGYTHLHVHFATPAAMVGLLARVVYPIGFSMTVHGPDEFYDVTAYRLREKIAGAAFVCCIGYYCRSQLMKLTPPSAWDKFEIAPLGVDPAAFAPRPFRAGAQPFNVLCVGRLVPAKGQHVLIAAVAALIAAGRDVQLRLVGDGPDRDALEDEVAARGLGDRVRFDGVVNQDEIRAIYAAADCFALASFAEGIPVVLMEAMAMEIPCVTTFITGHPELIRDGVDGLLVAPSDEAGLAAAIAGLIDDPERCQRLGEAGRRRVQEKYDLDTNTRRLADILRRRLEAGE